MAAALLSLPLSAVVAPRISFVPEQISFARLADASADGSLSRVLRETGLVAISDIPNYAELRTATLLAAHKCAESKPVSSTSSFDTPRPALDNRTLPSALHPSLPPAYLSASAPLPPQIEVTTKFEDGTFAKTLPAMTNAGGMHPVEHPGGAECDRFGGDSEAFRSLGELGPTPHRPSPLASMGRRSLDGSSKSGG
eukprot:6657008-Prymnesium_polylepis.1